MKKLYQSTDKNTIFKRKDRRTAAIYVRVSSEEQIDNASIPTQLAACRAKLAMLDAEEVGIFIEEGESAKTSDRSQFQNLLTFVTKNAGNLDYVMVYQIDRWARNLEDHVYARKFLIENGATLCSVLEPIDDSHTGRFIETMMAAMAELDNKLKGQRVKDCMARKALDGWPQNKSGYGYKNDSNTKRTVIDEQFFEPIRTILVRYSEGEDIPELTKYLNKLGLRTKATRLHLPREFKPKDVWKILTRSKFYAGFFDHKDNKNIQGKYPPMITWDTHLKIQSRISNKSIVNIMNTDELNTYILNFKVLTNKRFLTCACCGSNIRSTVANGNGGKYPVYYCSNGDCKADKKSVWKTTLEKGIEDLLQTIAPTEALVERFKKIMEEEWHSEYKDRINLKKIATQKLAQIKYDRQETISLLRRKLIREDDFKSEMTNLEIAELAEKRTLNENNIDIAKLKLLLAQAGAFLRQLKSIYMALEVNNKRKLLSIVFPDGAKLENGELKTTQNALLFRVISTLDTEELHDLTLPGFEPGFIP